MAVKTTAPHTRPAVMTTSTTPIRPANNTAVPTDPRDREAAAVLRPPMPDIGPKSEFSGPVLRQIREAAGIELRELSERSKIGMGYLAALEGEQWHKLPAPVYVRGFLVEYARILGLPGVRVKETYLERYRAGRGLAPDAGGDGAAGRKKTRTDTGE